jgi:AGCS family alanine or glycine:cation symporter
MWLAGVFSIATKYSESLIAVKYRVKSESGQMMGGAMYALERGLNMKWLGVLFAAFTAVATFGIGNGVQSNAVATLAAETFYIPRWLSGLALATLVALVLLGGIKRITDVCVRLVPFMALFYVAGCLVILVMNREFIMSAAKLIGKSAFSPRAAGGGFAAASFMSAARYGIARGLFSNESGMGSAPIVAAAAQTRNPVRQALVSSTGTFWDTVVVCAITSLVIVSSALAYPSMDTTAGSLTNAAFSHIPIIGTPILVFGLVTFAFSTILGWSYYGERCAEYLFGPKAITPYRFAYVTATFFGATAALDLVWNIADALNASCRCDSP